MAISAKYRFAVRILDLRGVIVGHPLSEAASDDNACQQMTTDGGTKMTIEHTKMRSSAIHGGLVLAAGCAALAFSSGVSAQHYSDWEPPVSAEVGSSSALNSSANDGCPIQSPDGLSLFMATNRTGGPGGLDIWVAHRASQSDGWGAPEPLPAPVNSSADDFCPTPLRGDRLLFVSKRDEPNGDIYETRWSKKGWSTPINLGPNVNSSAQEWSPSLFEDEQGHQVLYFSSTRAGTQDIFESVDFGPAHPVAELNTAADDARPNVSKNGREIVFDTTRATSPTNPDIWTATRDSTSSPWSAPVPLPVLNSPKPDTRVTLSWDGLTMVFGSARDGGEGAADIYVTHRHRVQGNYGKTIDFDDVPSGE